MKEMLVMFMVRRNAFTVGGVRYTYIGCEIDVSGRKLRDLGKGYFGYLVQHKNRSFVVESVTGAVVGSSLDLVRGDIAYGDEAVMRQQVQDELALFDSAKKAGNFEMVEFDQFFEF